MMTSQSGLRNRPNGNAIGTRRGLTLLELVLVMALLALLAGAVAWNVSPWRTGERLEEGMERFQTVLRMARAEAATTGRRLRLAFGEETGQCSVLWEPEPLSEPEQFTDYARCTWKSHIPTEMVRVLRSELTGSSAYRTLRAQMGREETEDNALQAVTFYPDGSSDSAVFELVDAEGSESFLAIIVLDGVNGVITARILSAEQYEQQQDKADGASTENKRG